MNPGNDHHFLLGGQRSGKSRRAEGLAAAWLATPGHEAVLIATAFAGDAEMAERIAVHRRDRAERVPGLGTVEEPRDLAGALRAHSQGHRLVVVDCLTLWLTNLSMPLHGPAVDQAGLPALFDDVAAALVAAPGPVVLVSNEIGLGLSPLTREARRFVDELGRLHQLVATVCGEVTLMVAGLPVAVKRKSGNP
jgi:adenosylcobinamide kinase/adenosylcobinamide-phosphate guanylyltransferase